MVYLEVSLLLLAIIMSNCKIAEGCYSLYLGDIPGYRRITETGVQVDGGALATSTPTCHSNCVIRQGVS